MIKKWAYDVEILPNFFSIVIVDVDDYLRVFDDACTISIKKGKEIKNPIPLTQKYSVKEIIEKLDNVKKYKFYITDTDDSQLLEMIAFLSNLQAHFIDNSKKAIRNDMFGYNNNGYDKLMIAALFMYYNNTNNTKELIYKLYETSQHIINIQKNKELARTDYLLKQLREYSLPYVDVDVMTIFALNKVGGGKVDKDGNKVYFPKSLKQTSINLQWYELLEHDLPPIGKADINIYHKIAKYKGFAAEQLNQLITKWDRYIIPEWIEDVMHYNANDVFIVCEMIRLYKEEIASRYAITKAFQVDVLSASRSRIGDIIFEKLYSDNSGLHPSQWKGKKTERNRFAFKKIIFPYITFQTPALKELLDDMKQTTIYSIGKSAFVRTVRLGDLDYTVATGGLHSKDTPRKLVSKINYKEGINESDVNEDNFWDCLTPDSYIYRHYDITSFYPSIMIAYDIHPEHMDRVAFRNTVKYCKDTRVQAKHSSEPIDGIPPEIMALVLKIVINAIYGKFGYEFGDLFDRLATLQVTINGQLMIMMLCESLTLAGIEVVSANTDGIVVKLSADKKAIFDNITKEWTELTKMSADSEDYLRYVCRDINNYAAEEINHKVTTKGDYNPLLYAVDLSKGYDMPIVTKAAYDYLLYDKPILDTLYECTNILDFCKTQNVGRDWICVYTSPEAGRQIVQRNNRFYVSTNGGTLEKVERASNVGEVSIDADGKLTGVTERHVNLCAGQRVQILNTLDDKPIMFRNISYNYYYEQAMKLIDPIVLGISSSQKGGKTLLKKYGGMTKTLFDDD